jgi:hypothetical protein
MNVCALGSPRCAISNVLLGLAHASHECDLEFAEAVDEPLAPMFAFGATQLDVALEDGTHPLFFGGQEEASLPAVIHRPGFDGADWVHLDQVLLLPILIKGREHGFVPILGRQGQRPLRGRLIPKKPLLGYRGGHQG